MNVLLKNIVRNGISSDFYWRKCFIIVDYYNIVCIVLFLLIVFIHWDCWHRSRLMFLIEKSFCFPVWLLCNETQCWWFKICFRINICEMFFNKLLSKLWCGRINSLVLCLQERKCHGIHVWFWELEFHMTDKFNSST